jgi:hypothetical protein
MCVCVRKCIMALTMQDGAHSSVCATCHVLMCVCVCVYMYTVCVCVCVHVHSMCVCVYMYTVCVCVCVHVHGADDAEWNACCTQLGHGNLMNKDVPQLLQVL